jgi:hypothetical protein
MSDAIKSMLSSKKFLVFLTTVITAIVVAVTGLGDEQAAHLVDEIISLAMAYMGGQGLADAGKYFGQGLNGHGKDDEVDDVPEPRPDVLPADEGDDDGEEG